MSQIAKEQIIAELAERSPTIIQNSSNPSSRKNLDVRPYDRTRYYFSCVVNCTAGTPTPRLCGQCTRLRVGQPGFWSWPGQGVVPLRRAGKKKRAPLLGLAKSIYYKKLNYAGILIGSHVRSIGEHTHTQRQHQPHSAFFIT